MEGRTRTSENFSTKDMIKLAHSCLHEFEGPDGTIRKAPTMMWNDAMRAIQEAQRLRDEK